MTRGAAPQQTCAAQTRLVVGLVAILSALAPTTGFGAVAIDVRSRSRLLATAECDSPAFSCTVRGSLLDDLGEPLVNQTIRANLEANAVRAAGRVLQFEECPESSGNLRNQSHETRSAHALTDARGNFCLRVTSAEPITERLQLSFTGDRHTDAETTHIDLGVTRQATRLDWINAQRPVQIEAAQVTFDVRLRTPSQPIADQPVTLALLDERANRERVRRVLRTDSAGTARLAVPAGEFATVGAARLEAHFAGNETFAPNSRSWPVFRSCTVRLAPGASERRISRGEPAVLSVRVDTYCGGPVPGIIEFSSEGEAIARAPVKDNSAQWSFTTTRYSPGPRTIIAKYVAPSEAWSSNAELRFELLIEPPSKTGGILWLLGALGLVAWIASRWGRAAIQPLLRRELPREASGDLSLAVSAPEPGKAGWYGVVIDAHTGLPIADALLKLELPGFAARRVSASATSSPSGEFALPPNQPVQFSKLVVSAPHYHTGRWPLPAPGRLTIRLQTTRRAILQGFVSWFEATSIPGVPPRTEPTPAQIRRGGSRPEVVEWAKQVEDAAFGPSQPDPEAAALLTGPPLESRVRKEL